MFVVTSHAVKCDTGISIGYNLNEAAHPLVKLQAAGIAVEFTPINGGEPPLDGLEDMNDPIIARYWTDVDFRQAMAHTKAIAEINPSDYSAIFFAGGHGTMWDFPDNVDVHRAIREIYENGGIVSAVCHGPAALVNVRLSDGSLLIADKNVASFTDDEEA